jgi:hypothetical protein
MSVPGYGVAVVSSRHRFMLVQMGGSFRRVSDEGEHFLDRAADQDLAFNLSNLCNSW